MARMNTAAKRMFCYYAIGANRDPKSQKGVVTAYRQLRRFEMYLPLSFAVVIAIRCHCGKVIMRLHGLFLGLREMITSRTQGVFH